MKISVSLPQDAVVFLDQYASSRGLTSRSAAVQRAIDALRAEGLGAAYADAWETWGTDDAEIWESTVADGLGPV